MPNGALSDREMIVKLHTLAITTSEDIADLKQEFSMLRQRIDERPYPCTEVIRLKTERNAIIGILVIALPLMVGALIWLFDKVT